MGEQDNNLTELLRQAADGDANAHDALFAHIYPTLRKLAHRQLSAHRKETLCTTDLVNEASLRLFDTNKLAGLEGHRHLYATAAKAMRNILVDYARQKSAQKRGGEWQRLSLDEGQISAAHLSDQILALEDALEQLHVIDERGHQIVELKFFGGLTIEEIGEYLGVSAMTVKRDWRRSRAFLYAELEAS